MYTKHELSYKTCLETMTITDSKLKTKIENGKIMVKNVK